MNVQIPPPIGFVRALGLHHWYAGLEIFDGKQPLTVLTLNNLQVNENWVHTIEVIEKKILCVTRLNGSIKESFEATTLF
jgi:hypothetical protein